MDQRTPPSIPGELTSTSQFAPSFWAEATKRHRASLIVVVSSAILIGFMSVQLRPKQYQSVLSLEVQNSRTLQAVGSDSAQPAQGTYVSPDLLDMEINTEVQLLSSDDLIRDAFNFREHRVHPDKPLRVTDGSNLLDAFASRLSVTPVRKSLFITVTYVDSSPVLAQAVLDHLRAAYIQKRVRLQRPAGTSQFFTQEAERLKQQKQDADLSLSQFRILHQFSSLQAEKDAVANSLDKARSAVLDDQVTLATDQRELQVMHSKRDATLTRIATQARSIPNQAVSQQLVSALNELQLKRESLATLYIETDPVVKDLDAQIAVTKNNIKYSDTHNANETTSDNNPAWMTLNASTISMETAVPGLTAKLAAEKGLAASYQARLAELEGVTPTHNQLERHAEELAENQKLIVAKRDSSHIDDLLDLGEFGNVAIVDGPTLATNPVGKAVLKTVGLFVTFGVALWMLWVFYSTTYKTPGVDLRS